MNFQSIRKNPWPYALITYFALFFSFIVVFVIFASRQRVDLVRADYYEAEIKFQQQIDRVERSRPVEAQCAINYDLNKSAITIQLPPQSNSALKGQIELYRPSDARQDKTFGLSVDSNGKQQLDVRTLKSGLWKIRVNWTSAGTEYFVEKPITIANS